MPLTKKGDEIRNNMEKEYGKNKGESVFYASRNKGTVSGVDSIKGRRRFTAAVRDSLKKGQSFDAAIKSGLKLTKDEGEATAGAMTVLRHTTGLAKTLADTPLTLPSLKGLGAAKAPSPSTAPSDNSTPQPKVPAAPAPNPVATPKPPAAATTPKPTPMPKPVTNPKPAPMPKPKSVMNHNSRDAALPEKVGSYMQQVGGTGNELANEGWEKKVPAVPTVTKDALKRFRKSFRDAVKANEPLSKCIELGVISGVASHSGTSMTPESGKNETSTKDRALFRKSLAHGASIGDALKAIGAPTTDYGVRGMKRGQRKAVSTSAPQGSSQKPPVDQSRKHASHWNNLKLNKAASAKKTLWQTNENGKKVFI